MTHRLARLPSAVCVLGLLLACCRGTLAAESLSIENDSLKVTFDAASGFRVQSKPSGRAFVPNGLFEATGGQPKITALRHPILGDGQALEITYPNGNQDTLQLFPGLPFVLSRSTLHNGGKEPVVLNHVAPLWAALDAGKPVDDLRAFGTGGLSPIAKNPGSYAYLAVVDPATRGGVVAGWLTHDRGSGVVFSPVENGSVRMQAQIDYGRLRIKPGQDAQTETFALGWFDDARLGLEAYADAVARLYAVKLPPQPSGYCTWYADKHAGACDEQYLPELARFAAEQLKPYGFDFVQIDDHWQAGVSKNGPKRGFMTHNPNGPYPSGMKAAADGIRQLGLTPGIWFMPFAGTSYDPLFADHQDWFARTADGKPFEARWGGTCLDMTQPGPRKYLADLVHRLHDEWGYRLFKMDGLWTGTATRLMYVNNGYQDDSIGEALLADPDKTNIEAFRDGLKLVRQAAGPDVYLLGCCVSQNMRSFGGAFGLVDGMRVGPDTGAGRIGAPHASRNYFLHGRVWQNDPDCVSVRAATPLGQARLNASFTAIAGHLFYNSDWMPDLPAERLEILKRTLANHGLLPRPVDLFENDPARLWILTDTRRTPRRDCVAVYNWDQKSGAAIECPLDRLGLPAAAKYVGFDFWANKFLPPLGDKLAVELPPASCRILALRPAADFPQLVSTSRHVTQGMLDVLEEKWDAATRTLSGVSRVVGNDRYELRIALPVSANSWQAAQVEVAAEDAAAGVKTEFAQQGPKLRAAVVSPTSRTVHWRVRFEPAKIELPVPGPVADLKAETDYTSVKLTWQDNGADRYRVTRSDGQSFDCISSELVDSSAALGKKYQYSVAAMNWSGAASAAVAVEVTTPAELKRPPAPPMPNVHLADLKPVTVRTDWGKPQFGKSVSGGPLSIEGKRYDRGLGVHANALAVYAIPKGASRFVALVGLDDAKRTDPRSSVTFEVYADVKEMGEAPVLLAKSPVLSDKIIRSWAFNVELNARHKELRLVVTDAGDGIASDHADWVNAGFVTAASAKP